MADETTYSPTEWLDQIDDPITGEEVQKGTKFSATRMNKIEGGIAQAHDKIGILSERFKLPSGKKFGIVAGVIRNQGSGWALINDGTDGLMGGHRPLNIDSIEYDAVQQRIKVNYPTLGAKKVISFAAVPDETFAVNGFQFGCSVAPDYCTINIGKPAPIISARVYYNGSAWVVEGKSGDGALAATPWSGTAVRVTHASIPEAYPMVCPFGSSTYRPVIDAVTDGQTNIKFLDSSGSVVTTPDTNMDCFLYRGTGSIKKVDPNTITDALYPWSNIWLLGIMEL